MDDTTAKVQSENAFVAGYFAMPKIEFAANLRELAEGAVAQTRDNYERID